MPEPWEKQSDVHLTKKRLKQMMPELCACVRDADPDILAWYVSRPKVRLSHNIFAVPFCFFAV